MGELASGPAHEALTNKLPRSIEQKNWPNPISTESIPVGQYAIDLAIPITAEEQKWVDKFIIVTDEEMGGDMS
jgi:hypothetical protein